MEWMSVKDRLPEERVDVLVYGNITNTSNRVCRVGMGWLNNSNVFIEERPEDISPLDITHWMPLPNPPAEPTMIELVLQDERRKMAAAHEEISQMMGRNRPNPPEEK